jgi:hypothetical protein
MDRGPSVELLPFAITQFGLDSCVAGVDLHGDWIRPVPILPEHLAGTAPVFRYDYVSCVLLGSRPTDGQAEDRTLLETSSPPRLVDPATRLQLLDHATDTCVAVALSPGRSIGMVAARNCRVEARRHTGGRKYLRMSFTDLVGETFDWVCAELMLNRNWRASAEAAEAEWIERASRILAEIDPILAIALGDRNDRFPGRYDGRHPLCVGIHTRTRSGDELDGLFRYN